MDLEELNKTVPAAFIAKKLPRVTEITEEAEEEVATVTNE